jgi:hypothetical protein
MQKDQEEDTMRKLALLMLLVAALGIIAIPALGTGAQEGQAGDSNTAHVDFKPPRVWGTLHYNLSGCTLDFVFNGHGLMPGETYKVEFGPYYDHQPLPGDKPTVWVELGMGVANDGGNVHIAGSADPSSAWWLPGLGYWRNRRFRLLQMLVEDTEVEWKVVLNAEGRYDFRPDCPE